MTSPSSPPETPETPEVPEVPETPEAPANRTAVMLKRLIWLSLCVAMLVLGVAFAVPLRQAASRLAVSVSAALPWTSPPHDHEHSHDHGQNAGEHYTCGMHPWVILPQPGDCPICHMALVPLDPAKFTGQIAIDPAITQRIGVRTAKVTRATPTRVVRTVGSVDYDETLLHEITLKYGGWIEKLHVNTVGQRVAKGQPLFEIHAPEIYVAQEEYLHQWRRLRAQGASEDDPALAAAKRRLTFFGVTPGQIEALEKRGHSEQTLTVISPADGVVLDRQITLGAAVTPNVTLYRIADLSRVWVQAAVYEQQLPLVHPGTPAAMTLPFVPGQTFAGQVDHIYPYLDPTTRQARARLSFPNPDGLLKPGMFAQVVIASADASPALLIPRNAVIDTGKRQVVFIDQGQGRFEPRDVTLGLAAQDGLVEVLQGLAEDETIVTSGQFMLDGEANLRQALAQMMSSSAHEPQGPGPRPLTPEAASLLNELLDHYLAIAESLSQSQPDVAEPARKLAIAAQALTHEDMPGQPTFWTEHHAHMQALRNAADKLAEPRPLADTRVIFRDLSRATTALVQAAGVPGNRETPLELLSCSMYLDDEPNPVGGDWITPAGVVRNPYFGSMMLRCYTAKTPLPSAPPGSDPGSNPAPGSDSGKASSPSHDHDHSQGHNHDHGAQP